VNPEIDETLLTAYALGELDAGERERIAGMIEFDVEAQRFVESVRETAATFAEAFSLEPVDGLGEFRHREIAAGLHRPTAFSTARVSRIRQWLPLAASIAASIVIVCGTVGLLLSKFYTPSAVSDSQTDRQGIVVYGSDGRTLPPELGGNPDFANSSPQTRPSIANIDDHDLDWNPVKGMVDPRTFEQKRIAAARANESKLLQPPETRPAPDTAIVSGPAVSPDAEDLRTGVGSTPPKPAGGSIAVSPPRDPDAFKKMREAAIEERPRILENPFRLASHRSHSSFPVRVDSASYRAVRAKLLERAWPAPDRVGVEELVNHFPYDYPAPPPGGPALTATVEIATCPWNVKHRLARVAIMAADGEAKIVAKAVSVSVEFNPLATSAWRLIGYENAPSTTSRPSTVPAMDLPACITATALYEILPTKVDPRGATGKDLFTVNLNWLEPADASPSMLTIPAIDPGDGFDRATDDFRFASAVAAFGMLLRDSQLKGTATYGDVIRWATPAKPSGESPERAEFIDLARRARDLTR
jgi:hypothetical protein